MSDDAFSARELRQRNLKGGSLADDALSAAQLRARHGVAHNAKDWATRHDGDKSSPLPLTVLVGLALLLLGVVAWVAMAPAKQAA